jgi:hypothetical protein
MTIEQFDYGIRRRISSGKMMIKVLQTDHLIGVPLSTWVDPLSSRENAAKYKDLQDFILSPAWLADVVIIIETRERLVEPNQPALDRRSFPSLVARRAGPVEVCCHQLSSSLLLLLHVHRWNYCLGTQIRPFLGGRPIEENHYKFDG